jgi:hypothetical protein
MGWGRMDEGIWKNMGDERAWEEVKEAERGGRREVGGDK